ncbi:MAG: hypothetical protein AAFU53_15575 [Cyanobacteria bacterium J06632_3]
MESFVHFIIAALGDIIQLVLTLLAISVPAVCALKGYSFLKTNLISIPVLFAIVFLGAYLADIYPLIQLNFMGFDFQGMNETERMLNVNPVHRDAAAELYGSIFGIGWPLKAIFAMLFVTPYPSAVWVAWTLVKSSVQPIER